MTLKTPDDNVVVIGEIYDADSFRTCTLQDRKGIARYPGELAAVDLEQFCVWYCYK